MVKCAYCPCTVAIPPGKNYCHTCGHDAVDHIATNSTTTDGQGRLIAVVVIVMIIAAVYFSSLGTRESTHTQPVSQGVQLPPSPPVVNESASVPVAPPPGAAPSDRPYTPPAPPLGPWKSKR